MNIKPQTAIALSAAIVIAGIALTSILGLWTTQSTKVPQRLQSDGLEGQYDPGDIRGSYTFSEISELFGVPLSDLASAFLVDEADAAAFQCKNLESIFADAPTEIGTGSVRLFVAVYLGLPFDDTEDTFLPDRASDLLRQRPGISRQALDYLALHTVTIT